MNYYTEPPVIDPNIPLLILVGFLVLFSLFACATRGKNDSGSNQPPPLFGAKATLVLFGAPPCSNCHRDFPVIRSLLDGYPASDTQNLGVLVVVETGVRWTDPPTEYLADQYVLSLGLGFARRADGVKNGRPSYQLFTELTGIPLYQAALPAAALVAKGGKVLKVYPAGGLTFVPQRIVEDAVTAARE